MVFRDVASGPPASTYASAMPTIDSGWLDKRQRFPPPGPEPAQKQPKQPVSWAKPLIRTREDDELVAQGQSLEQEVSTRCPSRSDRSTRPDDGSHRLVECRPATPTSIAGDLLARELVERSILQERLQHVIPIRPRGDWIVAVEPGLSPKRTASSQCIVRCSA